MPCRAVRVYAVPCIQGSFWILEFLMTDSMSYHWFGLVADDSLPLALCPGALVREFPSRRQELGIFYH